jgi:hypothetical protein
MPWDKYYVSLTVHPSSIIGDTNAVDLDMRTGTEQIGWCPASPDDLLAGNNQSYSVIDMWVADDGGGEHGARRENATCVFCPGTPPPGVDPANYKPMVNGASYLGVNGTLEDFEEFKLCQRALEVIREHNTTNQERRLFLNYNMHVIHGESCVREHKLFAK